MTSPPGYPTADHQWLHRQQLRQAMAQQVHHAQQERAATNPWAMNPYLNQSKLSDKLYNKRNSYIIDYF